MSEKEIKEARKLEFNFQYALLEILQLKSQLQQKENIIKEVREYIKKHSQMTNLQINGIENVLSFRGSVEELLEILDKVSDE